MKRELLVITSLVFVLGCMVSCKSAQQENNRQGEDKQGPPTVDQLFEQMDANKDDVLSEKEVKGPLANNFEEIDTDDDGFLSKEELNNAPKPSGPQGVNRGGGRPQ